MMPLEALYKPTVCELTIFDNLKTACHLTGTQYMLVAELN